MTQHHAQIIFDLDGTISDPLEGIGRSINHALAHFGFPTQDLQQLAQYIGPTLDQAFRLITGVTEPMLLNAMVVKYRERYAQVGYTENVLYPGIVETLIKLSDGAVTLGVCTSKRVDFAERILDMFELRSLFCFVDGGDVGIHKTQQLAGLLSQELIDHSAVMVGDRAVDMLAAHRNGLSAAGALWGYGSLEELSAESPRYLFSSAGELGKLVGN